MSQDEAMTLSEMKEKALAVLAASEAHQSALLEHINQLKASLAVADLVIDEGKKSTLKEGLPIEDLDKEHLCIHVPGAIKMKLMTSLFDKTDSPFKEDSEQRARYGVYTTSRPWSALERKNLQDAIIREQKRALAIQAKKERHPDPLGYAQSQTDSFYLNQDVSALDWGRIAEASSAASSRTTGSPRSAIECRIHWLGFEQPSINKDSVWSDEENQNFIAITEEILTRSKNTPSHLSEGPSQAGARPFKPKINWSEVSSRMGRTRTPVQCLRHWLSNPVVVDLEDTAPPSPGLVDLPPHSGIPSQPGPLSIVDEGLGTTSKVSKSRKAWTNDDDDALREAVNTHGTSNWALVASLMPSSRTTRQCSERWRLTLDPSIKRGKWTAEEDELLVKAVQTYGTSWLKVKNALGGRTTAQCRERWCNRLDPAVNRSNVWTVEEDDILRNLKANQPQLSWPDIAKQLPGRTDNHCFRRWEKLNSKKVSLAGKRRQANDTEDNTSEGNEQASEEDQVESAPTKRSNTQVKERKKPVKSGDLEESTKAKAKRAAAKRQLTRPEKNDKADSRNVVTELGQLDNPTIGSSEELVQGSNPPNQPRPRPKPRSRKKASTMPAPHSEDVGTSGGPQSGAPQGLEMGESSSRSAPLDPRGSGRHVLRAPKKSRKRKEPANNYVDDDSEGEATIQQPAPSSTLVARPVAAPETADVPSTSTGVGEQSELRTLDTPDQANEGKPRAGRGKSKGRPPPPSSRKQPSRVAKS